MGNLHMAKVQRLAKDGFFGPSYKSKASCDPPLCEACIHRKQHKTPFSPEFFKFIDNLHLQPGDCVSCDQMESTQPGLIPTFRGSPTTAFYNGGTILVDYANRLIFFSPHQSPDAKETCWKKHRVELYAHSFNHRIRRYHADNGIFTSKPFKEACAKNHQQLTFCGVDAHHQNGIAEHSIRTVTDYARTMLIHAMIPWPEIIQESFWPFEIQLAIDIHNSTPSDSGVTPLEIFSDTKNHNNPLLHMHLFGCPIFVLEPTLCQNHKIPRWKPRLRVGVYLGHSPDHASSLPLVYSTTTGLVSPQFHVVFDDKFSTVKCLHTDQIPTNWPDLFNNSSTLCVDKDFSKTNFYTAPLLTRSHQHLRGSHFLHPSLTTHHLLPSHPIAPFNVLNLLFLLLIWFH
jgi:hypothetical protein